MSDTVLLILTIVVGVALLATLAAYFLGVELHWRYEARDLKDDKEGEE